MNSKHTFEEMKETLYSAVIADILDEMGYRNQAMANDILPLKVDDVVCGTAFTVLATDVYEIPAEPYKFEFEAVDHLQPGDVMIYSSGSKGHTRVYCGEEVINEVWPELANQGYIIVEGSLNEHSPWLSKSNPGYDSTFRVFRNVQPESESRWQDITICDNASMTTAGTAHSPTG